MDENSTRVGELLSKVAEKSDAAKGFIERRYERKVSPAIESAQEKIERASDYLEKNSSSSMSKDLTRLGRRHPKAAAGILFGLGFLLARKLYSSH